MDIAGSEGRRVGGMPIHRDAGYDALCAEVARRIKAARAEALLYQTELAEMIGAQRVSMCRWEGGKVLPQPCQLKKLAKAFAKHRVKFDVSDLFPAGIPKREYWAGDGCLEAAIAAMAAGQAGDEKEDGEG